MSSKQQKIKVGISIGDYNGIGPEIIMKSLKDKAITDFFTPIIFGAALGVAIMAFLFGFAFAMRITPRTER